MMIDILRNAARYEKVHSLLAQALHWLNATALEELPEGKTVIHGEQLFALVQNYVTRPLNEAKWEAHRRYWDVQFVVRGAERMGYAPLDSMQVLTPYHAAHDLGWFEGSGDFITLRAGMFCILGPHDVHAPGIAIEGPAPVRKVVLKVEM